MKKVLNTPNILTISRVLLIPVMVLCFFSDISYRKFLALFIFVFCSISDFLDGYIARTFKQTTRLGQILDPLADKLLIATTLILVIGFGMVSKLAMVPSSIILCRDIMVSEIRDIALQKGQKIQTNWIAKWKTATQMVSMSIILSASSFPCSEMLRLFGEIVLWISSALAIASAFLYSSKYWSLVE